MQKSHRLKVIIADDETDALEVLSNIISDTGTADIVASVGDPLKIESLVNKFRPDVLFLDIKMPGLNGLSLARNLREYNYNLKIVIVTAYDKYMSEAIKLNVYSYLLKPVDRSELTDLLNNLILIKSMDSNRQMNWKLKLPVKDGFVYLKKEELLMLEAEGNYTHIKTINNDIYLSSYNMGRLFNMLTPGTFHRINRNCIINGEYLIRINKKEQNCLVRCNGKDIVLPISLSFIRNFNRIMR